ncbi:MAG: RecX family transcriptional regulator [Deltaproteobacteria bacterium]|nr:MAG: RecX family transcriptional regulator [Deltaproteobacteria bacterium]
MKTITSLKVQKGNPGRVNVFVDHRYAFAVRLLDASQLEKGQQLSQNEISQFQNEDELYKTYRAAINFLAYRQRSQKETERHLKYKGFLPDMIGQTIERLRDEKYLNDFEFSRIWLKSRKRRNPLSKSALRFELKQKGVDEKIIKEVLMDVDDDELARLCAEKKLKRLGNLTPKDFKKKILRYLKGRGFSFEVSLNAYRHVRSLLDQTQGPASEGEDLTSNCE